MTFKIYSSRMYLWCLLGEEGRPYCGDLGVEAGEQKEKREGKRTQNIMEARTTKVIIVSVSI